MNLSKTNLCVVSLLKTYMQHSEPWRQDGQKGQLLFGFVKPHTEVATYTIAGSVKENLKQAGTNNECKVYSKMSASGSKVEDS